MIKIGDPADASLIRFFPCMIFKRIFSSTCNSDKVISRYSQNSSSVKPVIIIFWSAPVFSSSLDVNSERLASLFGDAL